MNQEVKTFNSIKDYLNFLLPGRSIRLVSFNSIKDYRTIAPSLTRIQYRTFNSIKDYLLRSWKRVSTALETFNSIKDYLCIRTTTTANDTHCFQFHQGLSIKARLEGDRLVVVFQFHQGLSIVFLYFFADAYINLSIPSRIIIELVQQDSIVLQYFFQFHQGLSH